ncbi:hypothetical protein [Janibacter alittae]|uniref:PqqD family protein n=1 Tax=Janibacter alittae TaxID=3115209 RepID=A0ABZ2MJQ9_9MICO
MTMTDGDQRWRTPDGIAWVAGEGRVALIDTRAVAPVPLLVHEPVASLWPTLAEGPVSVEQLRVVADGVVQDDSEGFVHAALEMLRDASLVVRAEAE